MTAYAYSGQQLLELATESAYDDSTWLTSAVDNFNRIIARGDGIAVYANQELGHPELGQRKYVSYGGREAQLAGFDPPQRLPDFKSEINWRYALTGVCVEPVPAPQPKVRVTAPREDGTIPYTQTTQENLFGIPDEMTPVLLRYRVALDNHEPLPHREEYGVIVRYTSPYQDGAYMLSRSRSEMRDMTRAVYLIDDGQTVVPCYVAGWGDPGIHRDRTGPSPLYPEGCEPHVILHPFPLSVGERPDGRPVDQSGWMLGPRKAYHLKVSQP